MKISNLDIKNKTIAIFSANYLPNIGGIENFTYHLSETLEQLDNHTIIVTNNVFGLAEHEIKESGVEIYRLPCCPLLKGRLPLPHENHKFKELLSIISEQRIDYVLINARFYPHSLIAAKFAKQIGITPIILDHGSAYLTLNNSLIDFIIKKYEHLITSLLKHYPADYYGISQASLQWLKTFRIKAKGVINNSIDADAYLAQASSRNFRKELCLSNKDFLICFTGRLIPEKGIVPLVEAAEHFAKTDPRIHFIFAGDGPLKQFILEKKLNNIHLVGSITSSDIASLLTQSNVFCLPSRSEGFSTSLLEASACYTPSIITNVGGVTDLIPSSEYGIVIDNATQNDICTAIKELYENQSTAIKIGRNVGQRVRQYFSWRETANKVLDACYQANS